MTSSEWRFRHLAIVRQLKAAGERLLDATELCWAEESRADARQRIENKLNHCEAKLDQLRCEK